MSDAVTYALEGHVAVITMNKPDKMNRLDPELVAQRGRNQHGIRLDDETRRVGLHVKRHAGIASEIELLERGDTDQRETALAGAGQPNFGLDDRSSDERAVVQA